MKFLLLFLFPIGLLMAENQLKNETSPYLLQHKNNPVDWYPWGKPAFEKAKKENKYIFISIGYSTCHWCHVMAHESFEDQGVADLLNKNYVSIKIDKEQYPHVDRYYQQVHYIMNRRSGGWPLTIILTPDLKPFFAATYIPKNSKYGSIGLTEILNKIPTISKEDITKSANEIQKIVETTQQNSKHEAVATDPEIAKKVVMQYQHYFDAEFKGFSKAPKFPQATNIQLLLTLNGISKNKDGLEMALSALDAMAKGGIYDQIEGGFYRYSVDERWLIPHFEKMLYTNAELFTAYASAYQLTKNPLYKKVVQETVAEMDRRFQVHGVYQSASNADSENFEGKNEEGFYFVYDYRATYDFLLKKGIPKDRVILNLAYLGITHEGNFEGHLSNPNLTKPEVPSDLSKVTQLLVELRTKKKYPFIDNKINTAWNSLYIKAKFQARIVDTNYSKEAQHSLDELLKLMYRDGELYHQTIHGVAATQPGLLEDYAFLSACLFEAYQSTLDEKYLTLFKSLVRQSIDKFYKDGFWRESTDGFVTRAAMSDNSYASALAVNMENLMLYSILGSDLEAHAVLQKTMAQFSAELDANPSSYPTATSILLKMIDEPIFIKSSKINLSKVDVMTIDYPFVYKWVNEQDGFSACKFKSCFSSSKGFDKVKLAIEKLK